MPPAVALGIATVGSAVLGSRSASKASKAQVEGAQKGADAQLTASREANQVLRDQFASTQKELQPFITGAGGAFQLQQAQSGALGPEAQQQAFTNFNESPGLKFLRDRGLQGIDRNAAAQGSLIGGNTDKARIAFSQGLAQQDFGNQFNRLGAVTGTGLAAAQALGGVGSVAAQGQAQNITGAGFAAAQGFNAAGAARAQGAIGQGNAFSSGFGDLASIFSNRKLINEDPSRLFNAQFGINQGG